MRQKFPQIFLSLFLTAALSYPGAAVSNPGIALSYSGTYEAPAQPQQQLIKGRVTSAEGEPLPGVSIALKGKEGGTVTDLLGNFTLQAASKDILIVSFLGFREKEVPVNGRRMLTIVLEPDVSSLEQVVVVGYGTMQKSDLTGAISSVKLEKVNDNRVISVPEALQGKIAGVQILNNTGEPGSGMTFNIRGMTSVTGSNQPLIVVDGQPVESELSATSAGMGLDWGSEIPPGDPLASLNPADIASIEVLKDASSTAIYGSRGANGVVLITTRSGAMGKDRVTYTSRVDVSSLPKKLDVLSSLEFMLMRNEANMNDGKDPVYTDFQIDSISRAGNTNWQDLTYRDAVSQQHQVSVSGKNKKTSYYITGNYAGQNSIINNASFKRGGLRVNYHRRITPRLDLGIKTYFSLARRNFGQQSNGQGAMGSSVVMGALAFNPLREPYDEDGDLDEAFNNNPVLVTSKVPDHTNIRTLLSNLTLDYKITKGLTYTFKGGINDIYSLRQLYWPRGTFIGNRDGGAGTRADNSNFNFLIDNLLTYKRTFNKVHSVNAVGGFSYQHWIRKASSVTNTGFPFDALSYFNMEIAEFQGITHTDHRDRALASVLARVNYSYDRRYLLTLTGRYDGATRLASGNKWHLFPSVGIGWNISNEEFFKAAPVSLLKFRASYGIAGNESIAIGATQAKYGMNHGVIGQSIIPGFVLSDFENPGLTWEMTKQLNVGADIGFAKDRISFSVDWYKKRTTGLLINLSLPASATIGNYFTNLGEVSNTGLDIEGTFRILTGKVNWDAGANFSTFKNEVVDLGETGILYGGNYINSGNILLNQALQIAMEGRSISSFWGYKTNGIYQNEEEVAAGPEAGYAEPGDVRFTDTNGDGQITDADKTIIGTPNPDFTYGFNSSLSYKRFSFSFSILGSHGADLINLNRWVMGANHTRGNYNMFQDAYDGRWTGEGTSNLYPKLNTATARFYNRFPDWMVEDASFVRLQSASIGYDIKLPAQFRISGLRVFVSGTNLLTITDYTGYDPNINSFGHFGLMKGTDYGTLPQARTFSAGVELSL